MKFVFYRAIKGYETALSGPIIEGAFANGDEVVVKGTDEFHEPEGDGGIIMGVVKREILWAHQRAKVPLLYFDKGFARSRTPWREQSLPTWWRMCWQATHPTDYLMRMSMPIDRMQMAGWAEPINRSNPEGHVVLLGSSQKFHHTEGLPHPTEWARDIIRQVAELAPHRMVIYRPKPSWADAEAIDGSTFSHGQKTAVADDLRDAFCSITYGSIACVDSILAGIPCIVLGNGVARPVSSPVMRSLGSGAPYWAPRDHLRQWLANLAYCQFTPAEIEKGFAWATLKEQMRYAF